MRRASLLVFSFYLLVLFASCGDRTPIIEVQQEDKDPLKENLINANRLVAQSETTQIDAYVQRHDWKVTSLPCGARYMVTETGKGGFIATNDTVAVLYRLEALDGTVFYSQQRDTLVQGHRQVTLALDELLEQVPYGSKVRMIVPSGSAYGVTGDGDRVGGRTVIVYDIIEVKKL